jgi:hypothetical protein
MHYYHVQWQFNLPARPVRSQKEVLGDKSTADFLLVTQITQPYVHMCNGLFICQLYSLPDLLEEMDCKEDMPLMLPFASFVSLSQLIIVI